MHAIETQYKGHLFRSRLEARWAAMFDLLGWKWIYEPFDYAGYIPDFCIMGNSPLLIEVKPGVTIQGLRQHQEQVQQACMGQWPEGILILGSDPTIALMGDPFEVQEGEPGVWTRHYQWDPGHWFKCWHCGREGISLDTWVQPKPCNHNSGGDDARIDSYTLEEMWGKAHRQSRWTPR